MLDYAHLDWWIWSFLDGNCLKRWKQTIVISGFIFIFNKRASLACAARLADTLCPPQGWVLSCPKLVLDGQWEKPRFLPVNSGQYYILG